MRKLMFLLLGLVALSACASSTDPTKILFSENSQQALLLIKVNPAPIGYRLGFAQYKEEDLALDANSFHGFAGIDVVGLRAPQYVALLVDPATYVFQDLAQQNSWAVCFNRETRSFTVKPGEAVFLGELNPVVHLRQLQTLATSNNDLYASQGVLHHYLDGIIPPQITSPTGDSPDFHEAKIYEAGSMPMLHGRLQPVSYKPARFGTGVSLLGDRLCGGYFKEKLNQNSSAPTP